MMKWLNVAVRPRNPWPDAETEVRFEGHLLTLKPRTEKQSASVLISLDATLDQRAALELVNRFLSVLAWRDRAGIRAKFSVAGIRPLNVGAGEPDVVATSHFTFASKLPSDDRARLALALYREALAVNSLPYQFLGFFKIINVLHASGQAQTAWINNALFHLKTPRAIRRRDQLRTTEADIGAYLYRQGRCAVAHAFNTPLVDPDKVEDTERLGMDLPLVQELAELLMTKELGISS